MNSFHRINLKKQQHNIKKKNPNFKKGIFLLCVINNSTCVFNGQFITI